jgi:hypothetical protein
MLDALAKLFALAFFLGGIAMLVFLCMFHLGFGVKPHWPTGILAAGSGVSTFCGYAMLSVLK